MPEGTKVHNLVVELVKKGYTLSQAIAIAQSQTHQSYQTGKPIKG